MKKKKGLKRRDYKRAFKIACSLMNGDVWYGEDKDTIYTEIMEKNHCFSSIDYENYILSNLEFFRHGGLN